MKKSVFEYELPIEVESQKEGGYLATCPLWQDCFAQGDTFDETILEITAVAQSLIELYKEENLEIPLKKAAKKFIDHGFSIPIMVEV